MIVQTAPKGNPRLVILQTDHAATCGQIAEAFGNEMFAAPDPFMPMGYVAAHHDDGWIPIDPIVGINPETGLPHSLTETPLSLLLQTSAGSPAANELYHPYSGMMSSMHTVGLFHGRYGLSDKIFIDTVPSLYRSQADEMLTAELDRQDRLKEILEADPETAVLIRDDVLFHNYKLLQFFDTLALYFQMNHEENRSESYFENVPRAVGHDTTISIECVEPGVYGLSPYPFRGDRLAINYLGRPMTPQPINTDVKAALAEITPVTESILLIAA